MAMAAEQSELAEYAFDVTDAGANKLVVDKIGSNGSEKGSAAEASTDWEGNPAAATDDDHSEDLAADQNVDEAPLCATPFELTVDSPPVDGEIRQGERQPTEHLTSGHLLIPTPDKNGDHSDAETCSSVSALPGQLQQTDLNVKEGCELTTIRKLTLLPVVVAKAITSIIGTAGLLAGYGIGKVGEKLGSNRATDSAAWEAALVAWMYCNGIFPTCEYDPIDERTKKYYRDTYGLDELNPEDINLTPIVASNHVSYLDGPIYGALWHSPRFVAKAESRDIPLFGDFMESAQVVFVQRSDKGSRDATKLAIAEHCDTWCPGSHPLVIFPEGTTSNGQGLMDFKSGAFNAGVPVRPVAIVYTGRFDPASTPFKSTETGVRKTDDLEWVTELFGNLLHGCHIRVLQPYIPTEDEIADPKLYARNVRELIGREMVRVKAQLMEHSWKRAAGREYGGVDYQCGDFTRLVVNDRMAEEPTYDFSFSEVLAGLFGCVGLAHDVHSPPSRVLEENDIA